MKAVSRVDFRAQEPGCANFAGRNAHPGLVPGREGLESEIPLLNEVPPTFQHRLSTNVHEPDRSFNRGFFGQHGDRGNTPLRGDNPVHTRLVEDGRQVVVLLTCQPSEHLGSPPVGSSCFVWEVFAEFGQEIPQRWD